MQHIDLVPSILGALGIAPDVELPGEEIFAGQPDSRPILSEMSSPPVPDQLKFSLVRDAFKLICTPSTGRQELYDLNVDRDETRDRIADPRYRSRIASMRADLQRLLRTDRLGLGALVQRELTPEEVERLRSLGYAD